MPGRLANRKKVIFQLIISLVLLIGSGFLIYNTFVKEEVSYLLLPSEEEQEPQSDFEQLITIFTKDSFKNLIKLGEWPVEVKVKGRPNPFLKI